MDEIEKWNPSLKGVLPKIYADPDLNKQRLGELIDLIGTIGFNQPGHKSKDLLGRVYEYFLGQFADAEGKSGGQFYTPAQGRKNGGEGKEGELQRRGRRNKKKQRIGRAGWW